MARERALLARAAFPGNVASEHDTLARAAGIAIYQTNDL